MLHDAPLDAAVPGGKKKKLHCKFSENARRFSSHSMIVSLEFTV